MPLIKMEREIEGGSSERERLALAILKVLETNFGYKPKSKKSITKASHEIRTLIPHVSKMTKNDNVLKKSCDVLIKNLDHLKLSEYKDVKKTCKEIVDKTHNIIGGATNDCNKLLVEAGIFVSNIEAVIEVLDRTFDNIAATNSNSQEVDVARKLHRAAIDMLAKNVENVKRVVEAKKSESSLLSIMADSESFRKLFSSDISAQKAFNVMLKNLTGTSFTIGEVLELSKALKLSKAELSKIVNSSNPVAELGIAISDHLYDIKPVKHLASKLLYVRDALSNKDVRDQMKKEISGMGETVTGGANYKVEQDDVITTAQRNTEEQGIILMIAFHDAMTGLMSNLSNVGNSLSKVFQSEKFNDNSLLAFKNALYTLPSFNINNFYELSGVVRSAAAELNRASFIGRLRNLIYEAEMMKKENPKIKEITDFYNVLKQIEEIILTYNKQFREGYGALSKSTFQSLLLGDIYGRGLDSEKAQKAGNIIDSVGQGVSSIAGAVSNFVRSIGEYTAKTTGAGEDDEDDEEDEEDNRDIISGGSSELKRKFKELVLRQRNLSKMMYDFNSLKDLVSNIVKARQMSQNVKFSAERHSSLLEGYETINARTIAYYKDQISQMIDVERFRVIDTSTVPNNYFDKSFLGIMNSLKSEGTIGRSTYPLNVNRDRAQDKNVDFHDIKAANIIVDLTVGSIPLVIPMNTISKYYVYDTRMIHATAIDQNDRNKFEAPLAFQDMQKAILVADEKNREANLDYENAVYKSQIDLLEAAEAIDLYFKAFTEIVVNKPKDIRGIFADLETRVTINNWRSTDLNTLIADINNIVLADVLSQETATKIFNYFKQQSSLKIILSIFFRIGEDIGGEKAIEKTFRTPNQIYDAIVSYLAYNPQGNTIGNLDMGLLLKDIINAISAKVMFALDIHKMTVAPGLYGAKGAFSYSRMILGGADAKVNPALIETYFRIPLLIKFYRKLFFSRPVVGNNHPSRFISNGSAFTFVPSSQGPFAKLFKIVFLTTGAYSSEQANSIVEECNALYLKYGSCDRIMREIVHEVNSRIGIISLNSANEAIDLYVRNELFRGEDHDGADFQRVDYDILSDINGNSGAAPSSQYTTIGNIVRTQDKSIRLYQASTKQLLDELVTYLKRRYELAINNDIENTDLTYYIRSKRTEYINADENKKKDILHSIVNGYGDTTTDYKVISTYILHEMVHAPLNNCLTVYSALHDTFDKFNNVFNNVANDYFYHSCRDIEIYDENNSRVFEYDFRGKIRDFLLSFNDNVIDSYLAAIVGDDQVAAHAGAIITKLSRNMEGRQFLTALGYAESLIRKYPIGKVLDEVRKLYPGCDSLIKALFDEKVGSHQHFHKKIIRGGGLNSVHGIYDHIMSYVNDGKIEVYPKADSNIMRYTNLILFFINYKEIAFKDFTEIDLLKALEKSKIPSIIVERFEEFSNGSSNNLPELNLNNLDRDIYRDLMNSDLFKETLDEQTLSSLTNTFNTLNTLEFADALKSNYSISLEDKFLTELLDIIQDLDSDRKDSERKDSYEFFNEQYEKLSTIFESVGNESKYTDMLYMGCIHLNEYIVKYLKSALETNDESVPGEKMYDLMVNIKKMCTSLKLKFFKNQERNIYIPNDNFTRKPLSVYFNIFKVSIDVTILQIIDLVKTNKKEETLLCWKFAMAQNLEILSKLKYQIYQVKYVLQKTNKHEEILKFLDALDNDPVKSIGEFIQSFCKKEGILLPEIDDFNSYINVDDFVGKEYAYVLNKYVPELVQIEELKLTWDNDSDMKPIDRIQRNLACHVINNFIVKFSFNNPDQTEILFGISIPEDMIDFTNRTINYMLPISQKLKNALKEENCNSKDVRSLIKKFKFTEKNVVHFGKQFIRLKNDEDKQSFTKFAECVDVLHIYLYRFLKSIDMNIHAVKNKDKKDIQNNYMLFLSASGNFKRYLVEFAVLERKYDLIQCLDKTTISVSRLQCFKYYLLTNATCRFFDLWLEGPLKFMPFFKTKSEIDVDNAKMINILTNIKKYLNDSDEGEKDKQPKDTTQKQNDTFIIPEEGRNMEKPSAKKDEDVEKVNVNNFVIPPIKPTASIFDSAIPENVTAPIMPTGPSKPEVTGPSKPVVTEPPKPEVTGPSIFNTKPAAKPTDQSKPLIEDNFSDIFKGLPTGVDRKGPKSNTNSKDPLPSRKGPKSNTNSKDLPTGDDKRGPKSNTDDKGFPTGDDKRGPKFNTDDKGFPTGKDSSFGSVPVNPDESSKKPKQSVIVFNTTDKKDDSENKEVNKDGDEPATSTIHNKLAKVFSKIGLRANIIIDANKNEFAPIEEPISAGVLTELLLKLKNSGKEVPVVINNLLRAAAEDGFNIEDAEAKPTILPPIGMDPILEIFKTCDGIDELLVFRMENDRISLDHGELMSNINTIVASTTQMFSNLESTYQNSQEIQNCKDSLHDVWTELINNFTKEGHKFVDSITRDINMLFVDNLAKFNRRGLQNYTRFYYSVIEDEFRKLMKNMMDNLCEKRYEYPNKDGLPVFYYFYYRKMVDPLLLGVLSADKITNKSIYMSNDVFTALNRSDDKTFDAKPGVQKYVCDNWNELDEKMKENFKTYIPFFKTSFKILIAKANYYNQWNNRYTLPNHKAASERRYQMIVTVGTVVLNCLNTIQDDIKASDPKYQPIAQDIYPGFNNIYPKNLKPPSYASFITNAQVSLYEYPVERIARQVVYGLRPLMENMKINKSVYPGIYHLIENYYNVSKPGNRSITPVDESFVVNEFNANNRLLRYILSLKLKKFEIVGGLNLRLNSYANIMNQNYGTLTFGSTILESPDVYKKMKDIAVSTNVIALEAEQDVNTVLYKNIIDKNIVPFSILALNRSVSLAFINIFAHNFERAIGKHTDVDNLLGDIFTGENRSRGNNRVFVEFDNNTDESYNNRDTISRNDDMPVFVASSKQIILNLLLLRNIILDAVSFSDQKLGIMPELIAVTTDRAKYHTDERLQGKIYSEQNFRKNPL